ncbi:MAG: flagellar basal-body rod protein FlgG [Gammaproteobacteria bacterium]|nr:flagellar basal-body rod protein FlgG [Gammaproteobacteria bacterium]MDH5729790.1 flagellar basal-body rod protein FlgG [Gammaproteobacteria bacterium]
MDSLFIAATGMQTQQTAIDVIANNLANVNTPGFKKSRVDFEDLMYRSSNDLAAIPLTQVESQKFSGLGSAITGTSKIFSTGDMKQTESPYDFAINGDGFFEVVLPDGSFAYTRTGAFSVNQDNYLVNADGHMINPMISVPSDTEQLLVKPNGKVLAQLAGEQELMELGELELASFVNQTALEPIGNNLYLKNRQSGDAIYNTPGENGSGTLAQGFLESSNVKLVEELSSLMLAQRAYEINSKVIQAADELMGIVNNLKR